MIVSGIHKNKEQMRSYSTVFSRSVVVSILDKNDYSCIDAKLRRYDIDKIGVSFSTYLDYFKYIYSLLVKNYRCEYLYKNSLISELLIKKYGTNNTIALNEFKVGNSVADFVLFNGTSKAFEIKTELDSQKRLDQQLSDYTKIFSECYIVIPEQFIKRYSHLNPNIGIILFSEIDGKVSLIEHRHPIKNIDISVDVMMKSIRTSEYKNIIKAYFKKIPNVSSFDMFDSCLELMQQIPNEKLQSLFLKELKKRKNNTQILQGVEYELRQLCLGLNLNAEKYNLLEDRLSKIIKIQ